MACAGQTQPQGGGRLQKSSSSCVNLRETRSVTSWEQVSREERKQGGRSVASTAPHVLMDDVRQDGAAAALGAPGSSAWSPSLRWAHSLVGRSEGGREPRAQETTPREVRAATRSW